MQIFRIPFIYLHRENAFYAMKIVVISIILLAIAIVLMAVKVIFVKNGKFPSSHVHDNEALRNKDIKCTSCDDKK